MDFDCDLISCLEKRSDNTTDIFKQIYVCLYYKHEKEEENLDSLPKNNFKSVLLVFFP